MILYTILMLFTTKSYIMGDFNINLLKDDVHRPIHDLYLDLVYSHSLILTIYKPTRITEHSATIIDNILTILIISLSLLLLETLHFCI